MQYIVTEYKKLDNGRIEFCLNEKITLWLYQGEAKTLSLKEGIKLSEEEYQQIIHGIIGKRATKRAMHLLERQDRTEHQLREKLVRNAYPPEAIEDAIAYVKGYHYLDDERYARNFIRFHQESRSRIRLKSDLMQRGIARDIISLSIEEEFVSDERTQIQALLDKKHFSSDTADTKEYRKMYQFLMRKGFKSSDISAVLRQWSDIEDNA